MRSTTPALSWTAVGSRSSRAPRTGPAASPIRSSSRSKFAPDAASPPRPARRIEKRAGVRGEPAGDHGTSVGGPPDPGAVGSPRRHVRPPAKPRAQSHLTGTELESYDLPDAVRAGIRDAGFRFATPSRKGPPLALAGRDVAGQAQTGTGKTAAFLISAMTRLLRSPARSPGGHRVSSPSPRRELALRFGGTPGSWAPAPASRFSPSSEAWTTANSATTCAVHPDILIGTPGRLLDYEQQGATSFRDSRSPRDRRSRPDVRHGLHPGPATDPAPLSAVQPPADRCSSRPRCRRACMELAYEHTNNAEASRSSPSASARTGSREVLYHVASHEKFRLLPRPARARGRAADVLIFVEPPDDGGRARRTALSANGLPDQRARRKRSPAAPAEDPRATSRKGRLTALIATDVASRGLHIDGVTHVINYDLPQDSGGLRPPASDGPARAGAEGDAVSFADEDYVFSLDAIESLIGRKIPAEVADPGLYRHPQGAARGPIGPMSGRCTPEALGARPARFPTAGPTGAALALIRATPRRGRAPAWRGRAAGGHAVPPAPSDA